VDHPVGHDLAPPATSFTKIIVNITRPRNASIDVMRFDVL
jgi:hypothetical protein